MYYKTRYISPIGELTLASDGTYLIGLWIENQKYFQYGYNSLEERNNLEVFNMTKAYLDSYFDGRNPNFRDIPIRLIGTDFRVRIWERLLSIPYGETITYGDIARDIAEKYNRRVAYQSVGGAVGHNPISIIVPCHRVIGSDGRLTGYAGGIYKKEWLLNHENK